MKNQCSEKKNVEELLSLQRKQAKQMTILFGILKCIGWGIFTVGFTAMVIFGSPPETLNTWGAVGAISFLCLYSTMVALLFTGWCKPLNKNNTDNSPST